MESTLIQLFTKAKQHIPLILYIPNLLTLAQALPLSTGQLIRAMLDNIPPTDAALLLGVCTTLVERLPKDVKKWFGTKVKLERPGEAECAVFFNAVGKDLARRPDEVKGSVPKGEKSVGGIEKGTA